jgi:hypothetical protein
MSITQKAPSCASPSRWTNETAKNSVATMLMRPWKPAMSRSSLSGAVSL